MEEVNDTTRQFEQQPEQHSHELERKGHKDVVLAPVYEELLTEGINHIDNKQESKLKQQQHNPTTDSLQKAAAQRPGHFGLQRGRPA